MIEVDPKVLKQADINRVQYWTDRVADKRAELEKVLEAEAEADKSRNWFSRSWRWFWDAPCRDAMYVAYSFILDKGIQACRQQNEIFHVCDIALATGQSVWLQEEWSCLLPYIDRIINPEKQDAGN